MPPQTTWETRGLARLIACCACCALLGSARVEATGEDARDDGARQDEAEDEPDYGRAGSFELGGAVALSWAEDNLAIGARPSFGLFVLDRLELSLFLEVEYLRRVAVDGTASHRTAAGVVLEPSYHQPLADRLAALAGVGLGAGHDGEGFVLEVIPRLGLNILIGDSAVLTPAVRLPILVGSHLGETEGELGTAVRLIVEAGFTTTW